MAPARRRLETATNRIYTEKNQALLVDRLDCPLASVGPDEFRGAAGQPGNSRPESRGAATISAAIEYYGLAQCMWRRAGVEMPRNLIGH